MAMSADVASAHGGYRPRSTEERERAFRRAAHHSRIVTILRRTLPVIALVVLAAYFISSSMSVRVGDITASISGMEVSGGNLRMVNPKLQGANKDNGTYTIGADYADQEIKNPKVIKLHAIRADVANPSGGWSRMNAVRGVFDTRIERLVMQEKITIATSSGVSGTLKHATLDMKTQTLRSHRPVSFVMPSGTVSASALTLRSADHELEFRGKVKVHLTKTPKPEKEGAAAATKPSQTAPAPHVAAPPQPAGAAPQASSSAPPAPAVPGAGATVEKPL
ncbi:MAG: LPS export ABC transporter periplasmic protein LptC [Methyloceanibacter sp.]|uniref:LPS export ABC transporter periplasmic protein LptC n=1 Tax=Methyloceanibacter sp. TaxID=1965321 RepID=UPI003D9B6482